MPNEKKSSGFIEYLTSLSPEKDRGVLAVLRRGLGYPPAQDVDMYRYVARFVPDEIRGKEREKIYYLVAALYAFHPLNTDENLNFGNHMAIAASQMGDSTSTERRFTVLLNADVADLEGYLRQAVSFLKSRETPVKVNWNNLFTDLKFWGSPNKTVQRRWANSFWAYQKLSEEDQTTQTKEN